MQQRPRREDVWGGGGGGVKKKEGKLGNSAAKKRADITATLLLMSLNQSVVGENRRTARAVISRRSKDRDTGSASSMVEEGERACITVNK